VSLPPIFFYAMGTVLVVVGGLRFFILGRRRPGRELDEDTPQRAKLRRYHAIWGIIFVVVGAFLIASTAGILSRR
jgi:hypothetical protein